MRGELKVGVVAAAVLGRNWEICGALVAVEELFVAVVVSMGFPVLEREVEEEGNLKEKGEKVIFTLVLKVAMVFKCMRVDNVMFIYLD